MCNRTKATASSFLEGPGREAGRLAVLQGSLTLSGESPLQSFFFFLQLHVTCGILIP